MIQYEIEGGNLPVVICHPEPGQTICSQVGAMSWMSPNMKMETNAGGFKKAFGRLFSGESAFLNEYTAENGAGMIAFAASLPGSIKAFHLTQGQGIIVQKSGFLAMEKGLDLSVYFQKKIGVGLAGGEGFIMEKITGNGVVFIEIDGYCKEYDLAPGESVIIDTGYLAAMSESCSLDVQTVKGIKNKFLGGEGFFLTRVTGPGKVYIQSMPAICLAQSLAPYMPSPPSSDNNDGIHIRFGDH